MCNAFILLRFFYILWFKDLDTFDHIWISLDYTWKVHINEINWIIFFYLQSSSLGGTDIIACTHTHKGTIILCVIRNVNDIGLSKHALYFHFQNFFLFCNFGASTFQLSIWKAIFSAQNSVTNYNPSSPSVDIFLFQVP